jgi:hypothetical protein
MFTPVRHGALTVMEELKPSSAIARELKQLDDRLFLEKQLTFSGEEVWCVICSLGGDRPPATLLEWRDDRGVPIPELSSGIVSRMARMGRDADKLSAEVASANADRQARADRDSHGVYAEIAADMVPRMSGTRSAVLHRGQHLRRSRDKQRSKGENV